MLRLAAWWSLACGCFAPAAPTGAVCDPTEPRCPSGQACVGRNGGFVCDTATTDDAAFDAEVDAAGPLAHIRLATGWSADVFQDFSNDHTYVAMDFVDGDETFDNQPTYVFALAPPFSPRLAVIAGREILELDGTSYVPHDYGQHAPNTGGKPDHLTGGTFVPSLGGSPLLLVSSSSRNGGDGTFRIAAAWTIATDVPHNNMRGVLWDRSGLFDAAGSAEGYLAEQNGLFRRSDRVLLAAGDTRAVQLVGDDLLIARRVGTTDRLIEIASKTHTERLIVEHATIRLGEGRPLPTHVAWMIVDGRQLVAISSQGALDVIAEHSDPDIVWHAVTSPDATHPLGGRAYLLESNRTRDVDRLIALMPP